MNEVSLTFFKTCTKCECTKILSVAFFHYRSDSDSWRNNCKACHQVAKKLYRQRNPEVVSEMKRQSYFRNRDKALATMKKYQEENKESLAEYRRARYAENPRFFLDRWNENRKKHRARVAATNRKWKALKRNAEHEPYSESDLNNLWYDQGGSCAYCRTPLFAYYHIDHVLPLSRGGPDKLENLALSCPTCNMRKNAKTGVEFMEVLKREKQFQQGRLG